jgi:hypothetical protein
MNVHIFAEDIVGADRQARVLAPELEILRLKPDGIEWEEMIVFANRRGSLNVVGPSTIT